jgi:hypothetical protein
MLWKEIKSWAKKKGYESSKNEDSYSWYKICNPNINGEAKSVSKLAKAIFNDITNNAWLEHQKTLET